jgi:hypothetical protein
MSVPGANWSPPDTTAAARTASDAESTETLTVLSAGSLMGDFLKYKTLA